MIAVSTLVWFFVTIIMMGFFSGIEMAFFSANRFGIELKKNRVAPVLLYFPGFLKILSFF